jgi:hypothetical protein
MDLGKIIEFANYHDGDMAKGRTKANMGWIRD